MCGGIWQWPALIKAGSIEERNNDEDWENDDEDEPDEEVGAADQGQ